MHLLAVITSVPAAMTGVAEYFNIVGKRDIVRSLRGCMIA
jgi:hypothetical protein